MKNLTHSVYNGIERQMKMLDKKNVRPKKSSASKEQLSHTISGVNSEDTINEQKLSHLQLLTC